MLRGLKTSCVSIASTYGGGHSESAKHWVSAQIIENVTENIFKTFGMRHVCHVTKIRNSLS